MENNKLKILDSIGKIYEESKGCKLHDSIFKDMDSDLSFLSSYLKTTKEQAFFFSIIFVHNWKGSTVNFNNLIKYFECNPMNFLKYSDNLNLLCESKLLIKQKSSFKVSLISESDHFFSINDKVSEAILLNKPIPTIQEDKISDIFELLEKLYKIGLRRDKDEISTEELFKQSKEFISSNLHFPLIQKINQKNLNISESYLYLHLIWKTITGNESIDVGRVFENIYDNTTRRMNYTMKFLSGENTLIKYDLIEVVEARFFGDSEMKLTNYSQSILKDCGINLFTNKKKKNNVISPKEIPHKELIFSKSEMKQLFLLEKLLSQKNFQKTQKKLAEKKLSKAITALLYGLSGTGKTEVVKQIAKKTGRKLMTVDISQTKSAWYGESEKIIKRIFSDYKSFAGECDLTPILLFNEADAIISKRQRIGKSNTTQTENATQNILLEELENFEGILIATTNLINNLDFAFERRFLFKIKFLKPSELIKARIWKDKFPLLNEKDCNILAKKFDFSGGQIENILRKKEVHDIINNEKVNLSKLISFCEEETLVSNRIKIGFSKS